MNKVGLVLEGGGARGVFSAGVLDYFMEQNLYLPYVIGVSAGAGIGANYVSKQKGRIKETSVDYLKDNSYVGFKHLIQKRSLFDMDLIYDIFPNIEFPFDYNTFFASNQTCILTATNCLTGEAAYINEKTDRKRLMEACRASSSLPLVSPMVLVDGIPMLDGGMADSIPVKKAVEDGCDKAVIVLTRNKGYIKKRTPRINTLSRILYRHYPNLCKAIINRPDSYNQTIKLIEDLEESGKVYVIRPIDPVVKQTETNTDILSCFYKHGYETAKEVFPELLKFIKSGR